MRLLQVIYLGSIVLFSSCAAKAILMPEPVVGIDIIQLTNGEVAPFNGTEFSPAYLNEYLQWKSNS